MDNASIHNERDLVNLLAPRNITLVKLPRYSYDFNPIELVFGSVKVHVKRWPELLRANVPFAIVNTFLPPPLTQKTPPVSHHTQ